PVVVRRGGLPQEGRGLADRVRKLPERFSAGLEGVQVDLVETVTGSSQIEKRPGPVPNVGAYVNNMHALTARQDVEHPSLQGELAVAAHVETKINARAVQRESCGAHNVSTAGNPAHAIDCELCGPVA